MIRLSVSVLFGHAGYCAIASQSQVPLRVGDCVAATTDLEFFYKDEGEYERTYTVETHQKGVLLNIDPSWVNPSTVEWLKQNEREPEIGAGSGADFYERFWRRPWWHGNTREPTVTGAVFFHQFTRVPWWQGRIGRAGDGAVNQLKQVSHTQQFGTNPDTEDQCWTASTVQDGYQMVMKMSPCEKTNVDTIDANGETVPQEEVRSRTDKRWKQQFTFNDPGCGARPIRSTEDPSKCVDAVHPNKILLTDCSGVDSQKFLFRCWTTPGTFDYNTKAWETIPNVNPKQWVLSYIGNNAPEPETSQCQLLAMGGRKDMCIWWDDTDTSQDNDLVLRPCNYESKKTFTIERYKLSEMGLAQYRDIRDDVQAPSTAVM